MIFFTGASGVFGSAVLSQNLPFATLPLMRTRSSQIGATVAGDVTLPHCGLSQRDLRRIQSQVRIIIHAAADTRFEMPLQQARAVNTLGTGRVLDLAAGCANLQLFVQVSTVHIAGLRPGCLQEQPLAASPEFPNSYEQSKYEAEQLVCRAMATLPACIVRLTTIAGSEDSGFLQRENYLHRLIRMVPAYTLPVLPASPDALVDLASIEWTARAFAALIESARPGRVYHLSAGPRNAMPIAEAIGRAFQSVGKKTPRLVSRQLTEDLLRRVPNPLAAHLLKTLDSVLPHFQVRQEYVNDQTLDVLGLDHAPPLSSAIFDRVVERIAERAA